MIGLLLAMTGTFAIPAESGERPGNALVISGVVLEQGNNPLISRFANWLAIKADYPLTPNFAESYQQLSESLHDNPLSLAWTCAVPYVEDYASDQQQLIAVPLLHGSATYHSLVVSRAGRTEKTLADFKGQVFAYSDPRSNSGYVAPAYALKQLGIDIEKHFRYMMHTGLHEYSMEAVLAGQADVANIDEYVVIEYFKAHPETRSKLVVLEHFGPYPFTPVVAGSKVPEEVVERLRHALTTMHEDPEGEVILRQFGLDGFVSRPVSFYQPIVDMLNDLQP